MPLAPGDQYPVSVSADGTVLYRELHPKTGSDLWTLSPDGKTSPLRVTPFNETDGQFSPPGGGPPRVAYASDESGRSEIYVQSYPGGTNRVAVSSGGGSIPRWSRDGKELFYVTGDAVVAVAVRPDGKRFLMIRSDEGSVPRQLNVILNWSGAAN